MDEQVEGDSWGTESFLYDILLVDTCDYTWDETHSMSNTKNEP